MNERNNLYGKCPNCDCAVNLWQIAKPSLIPNRYKCKQCGVKFKYNYSWLYLLMTFLMGSLVGITDAVVAFYLSLMILGDYLSNDFIILFILTLIMIYFLSVIGLGILEAKLLKNRYKFICLKSE